MSPAFFKPMDAMKNPMPTPIAFFRLSGMQVTIASRTWVKDRAMNTSPSSIGTLPIRHRPTSIVVFYSF